VWLNQLNGAPQQAGEDVVDAIWKDRAGSGRDALKNTESM
jgi:hypothetical protein